jgi:hypothetical protein
VRWRLWVPGKLPGFNEVIQAASTKRAPRAARPAKASGSLYTNMKASWAARVGLEIAVQSARAGDMPERAYFTYLFREENRRRDPSNFTSGGIKIIEDALQEYGFLANDGWHNVLGFASYWVVDPEHVGVTVYADSQRIIPEGEVIALEEELFANGRQRSRVKTG